jgi:high-affinity nickel permease
MYPPPTLRRYFLEDCMGKKTKNDIEKKWAKATIGFVIGLGFYYSGHNKSQSLSL